MTSFATSLFNIGNLANSDARELRSVLAARGIALFECDPSCMRQIMTEMASKIGGVHLHPHGTTDGTTTITPNLLKNNVVAGLGFSRNRLEPHTDASSLKIPPAFLLNGCTYCASQGGATLLTNMQLVYEDLLKKHPDTIKSFTTTGSMIFGLGQEATVGSIFKKVEDRILVRFRMDSYGLVPASIAKQFCRIIDFINKHTIEITLTAGLGYILDNSWWLHGRTAFAGDREIIRVLVNQGADDLRSTGFPLNYAAPLDDYGVQEVA